MKRLLLALLCIALLCGCGVTESPAEPSQPEWREVYRDDNAVICALPEQSAEGKTTLCLTVSCLGGEDIVLSSLLCFSAQDEYGTPVAIDSTQGLDGCISPGETISGEIVFGREDLSGCVVSVALDFAAGRWIALNLT